MRGLLCGLVVLFCLFLTGTANAASDSCTNDSCPVTAAPAACDRGDCCERGARAPVRKVARRAGRVAAAPFRFLFGRRGCRGCR